ncbi:MAG: response regulator [Chloroflexota bacterium]
MPVTHRSVLLVDDEQLILDLYASALRLRGFAVHLASDATTARAICAHTRPDVICIDGRMMNSSSAHLGSDLVDAGHQVVIFTNDQHLYDHPPGGFAGRLIKVNTRPGDLADRLIEILERRSGEGLRPDGPERRLAGL